ncbi:MAG TPA: carboxylesterase/lipase family protein [Streptomyces sp.]
MIVRTVHGPIEGTATAHGAVFKGIPYAAPPTGPLRFRPPRPVTPWRETRPATAYGPAVPQPRDELLEKMFGQPPFPTDEAACLTVNVWTPSTGGGPRPVMVWLHGGAFRTGSGSDPVFDAGNLTERHDVVVVTLNYRLGALGFLQLAELLGEEYAHSGNVGLLDQVAALAWVRDNIAAFGGDPANVTLFGQSAGAMSALSLMAVPAAGGLFHKAIIQSGNAEFVHPPERATALSRELLSLLGLDEATAHRLHDIDPRALVTAEQALGRAMAARGEGPGLPFLPVVDGSTLPTTPLEAIRSGRAARVPLIVGANLEEARLSLLLAPPGPVEEAALPGLFGAAYRDPGTALTAYRAVEPDPTPTGLATALATEQMFRAPTARIADAHAVWTPDVWHYLFAWRSTALGGHLGACHSLELPFVFGNLDQTSVPRFTGAEPPQPLADAMGAAWTAFARNGTPGARWPAFEPRDRPTMIFDRRTRVSGDPLRTVHRLEAATGAPVPAS